MRKGKTDSRQFRDLVSIGPAMIADFALLGVESMDALAKQDPEEMYARLSTLSGSRQDICVLDTFHAAVAQARDPTLPMEQRQWWYYSRLRKAQAK